MDECVGPLVARWLFLEEHEVVSIFPNHQGMSDLDILRWGFAENRIVVTCDKDYGELVYHQGHPHKGVVLLRLDDETPDSKIAVLRDLMAEFFSQLEGNFVVVTESKVRINQGHDTES